MRELKHERHYDTPEVEHWHVEKKIPLALIFAMAVQTVCLVAFISRLDSRVGALEKDSEAKAWQAERIIRIDERLTSLQTGLAEIKTLLRAPSNNQPPASGQ